MSAAPPSARPPSDRPPSARPSSARPSSDSPSSDSTVRGWLTRAEGEPAGLPDAGYVALLGADAADLEALAALADAVRRDTLGDGLTFVANRNLDTAVAAADGDRTAALVDEAWALGATEVCVQGPLPAGAPARGYLDVVAAVTGRVPLHLHAFRPAEVDDAARRLGVDAREFLVAAREAGLGSVPGTAARILDDDVRAVLTGGTDLPAARWIELITIAHEVGLRSTATIVHGHVETAAEQVAHLRTLAAIQDRTGGFTELIAMPIQPDALPVDAGPGRVRRDGPSPREVRALHAVARLLLHGRIDHVQAAWPKLGPELTAAVLRGGADDAGGLLLDGTLDPAAGAEAGLELALADVARLAADLGRTLRQRTTTYDEVPAERQAVLRGARVPAGGHPA